MAKLFEMLFCHYLDSSKGENGIEFSDIVNAAAGRLHPKRVGAVEQFVDLHIAVLVLGRRLVIGSLAMTTGKDASARNGLAPTLLNFWKIATSMLNHAYTLYQLILLDASCANDLVSGGQFISEKYSQCLSLTLFSVADMLLPMNELNPNHLVDFLRTRTNWQPMLGFLSTLVQQQKNTTLQKPGLYLVGKLFCLQFAREISVFVGNVLDDPDYFKNSGVLCIDFIGDRESAAAAIRPDATTKTSATIFKFDTKSFSTFGEFLASQNLNMIQSTTLCEADLALIETCQSATQCLLSFSTTAKAMFSTGES